MKIQILIMALLFGICQVTAQDAAINSKQKIIDSNDLRWDISTLSGYTYQTKANGTNLALKFSQPRTFDLWQYEKADSILIRTGKWGFNPGGWLELISTTGAKQKFAMRKFVNFTFLMEESEVKSFESCFKMYVCGLAMIRRKNQIVSSSVIDACWKLTDCGYVNQE